MRDRIAGREPGLKPGPNSGTSPVNRAENAPIRNTAQGLTEQARPAAPRPQRAADSTFAAGLAASGGGGTDLPSLAR